MTTHYEHLVARRASLLANTRMPPALRARVEGRPPPPMEVAKAHVITINLRGGIRTVKTVDYTAMVRARPSRVASRPTPQEAVTLQPVRPDATVASIQAVFLHELWLSGYRITKNQRHYTREDLTCKARSRMYSWPRHTCMLLVSRIAGTSSTRIGKSFGGTDHTSVLYAMKKAPERMAEWPVLRRVHDRVLEHFGIVQ